MGKKRKFSTDLKVTRDGLLLLVTGLLQSGHVVGQVDVHVLDEVRPMLVGHSQTYHVERGRRFAVIGGVLMLMLLMLVAVLLAAVHELLDLGRHERA